MRLNFFCLYLKQFQFETKSLAKNSSSNAFGDFVLSIIKQVAIYFFIRKTIKANHFI